MEERKSTTGSKRRQSEVLRNIDDTLLVFNFLSVRSLMLSISAYLIAWGLLDLFALIGNPFLVIHVFIAVVMLLLAWAERHDDEHLVPSAIRYYVRRYPLYSGAVHEPQVSLEEVFGG